MGKTFCLLKPEVSFRTEEIEMDIEENNFSLAQRKKLGWKLEQIRRTYSKEKLNYGSERANRIMSNLIPDVITQRFGLNPPIEVLILSSEGNSVEDFVRICGPRNALEYVREEFQNTLRGKYGLKPEHSFVKNIDNRECRFDFNGIHRSSTVEEYGTELKIYF
jgi:nucleoside diphosphate kinase